MRSLTILPLLATIAMIGFGDIAEARAIADTMLSLATVVARMLR